MTRALLVTGGGGVGKTTLAAGLAITAARRGVEALVVTVDPARRLADALGQVKLGSEPVRHPDEPRLWAAMLDATASWRAIVERHATPEAAGRLLDSEFFSAATGHFPASQSYAAAEEMAAYLEAKVWDLVVVDTPPSAGGIEFFTAPAQMADLIGGRLLRWLTGAGIPGREFFFDLAARPALRIADSVLGSNLLERVAQFLMDLRTTYDGVSRRAKEIERLLRRSSTVVVTTSDPAPMREAVRFFLELPDVAGRPAAVVFNRALPVSWADTHASRGISLALAENLERWGAEARHQADVRLEFASRFRSPLATVPWQPTAPTDLDSLEDLIEGAEGLPLTDLGVG